RAPPADPRTGPLVKGTRFRRGRALSRPRPDAHHLPRDAAEHAQLHRHPLHHRDDARDLRAGRDYVPRPGATPGSELGDPAVLRLQPGRALLQVQLLLPEGPDHGHRPLPALARLARLGPRGRPQPAPQTLTVAVLSLRALS